MQQADILIEHGTVLTMDGENRVIEDGAIAIVGQRIAQIGTTAALREQFTARESIDARHMVVMPGLIDTYGHAGHGLIKALYHPRMGWPSTQVYFHASTDSWWYAEGMLSGLERLKYGVTCGYTVLGATPARMDSPVYAERQAEAAEKLGIRAVLGVGPPDPFVPHLPEPWSATTWTDGQPTERTFTYEETLHNTETVIEKWHGAADGRVQISVHYPYLLGRAAQHPRAPFTYDDSHIPAMVEKAVEIRELATRHKTVLHSHIFRGSVDFALEHFGAETVDSLLADDVVLAHSNGLGDSEIDMLGNAQVNIAVVPFTHENLWYGVCPVIELLKAGANVTISTDGTAPYTSYDLIRELSRAIWGQWSDYARQTPGNPNVASQELLPPGKALRMVTIDAARALNLDHEIGSLEVGKRADVILIDMAKPHLTPTIDIPRLLCFYANGADVDTVIVDGTVLMRQREVSHVDEQAILTQARDEANAAFAHVDVGPYVATDNSFWQGWRYPADD